GLVHRGHAAAPDLARDAIFPRENGAHRDLRLVRQSHRVVGRGGGGPVRYSRATASSTARRDGSSARPSRRAFYRPGPVRETFRKSSGCRVLPGREIGRPGSAMKKVEAIIKPFKLDEVKDALAEVGV